ncbi:hypothetical protein NPIL_314451 [Nephila pilipes]|uniref:Uncharacterized protein n=1 Tax=Nephila pilipes TaxID=299642 RepID=A0A8X6PJN5_NEPPI|nr:hypothetical protein NPIL_314451 [Nephila pilipes]
MQAWLLENQREASCQDKSGTEPILRKEKGKKEEGDSKQLVEFRKNQREEELRQDGNGTQPMQEKEKNGKQGLQEDLNFRNFRRTRISEN